MWISSQFLSISVVFSTIFVTDAIIVKNEQSLMGPYEDKAPNLAFWDLIGSAQLAETVIRLTTDEAGKQGGIWNQLPVMSNDWEIHVQFHIHGKGLHHNGEGIAIWFVKDPLHIGSAFGYKDSFSGLGVFIDTNENKNIHPKHKHPYISAMVNNGSMYYEHNDDGTLGQVGSCHIPVRNLEWPTKIAVSYISTVLTVFLAADGTEQWMECFRSNGVHLPTGYFFGVTASTGEVTDNHDIVSITMLDMSQEDKEWEDLSFLVPYAEFMQLPPQFHKKSVEDEVKIKEKREAGVEDEPTAPPASLMRKLMYVSGIGVLLFVAISMCKKYSAQRKERMQKRLF